MDTTFTIAYTTRTGKVKFRTVAAADLLTTLRRVTAAGGTINNIRR